MKRGFLAAICLILALFTACSGGKPHYETITAEKAKTLMDTETGYVILDVRTQEEYDLSHIPNAVCLDYEAVPNEAEELLTDKNQLILVYCRSGRRSAIAAQALEDLGYTNVKDFGGILDWPYEVEETVTPVCEGAHDWMEDCTGRTCAVCGLYERVAP